MQSNVGPSGALSTGQEIDHEAYGVAARPGSSFLGLRNCLDEPESAQAEINAAVPLPSRRFDDAAARTGARAMNIIDYFYEVRRPARSSEIAEALQLPRSTAHELLQTLVDTGFITFDNRTKRYFPSLRLARIGSWLSSAYFGSGAMLDVVEELAEITRENAAITVPNDHYMRVVAIAKGKPNRLNVREGSLIPILDSAGGCGFLMTLGDDDIVQLLRSVSGRRLTSAEAGVQNFLGLIRSFRAQGYAAVSVLPELISVTMPVYSSAAGFHLVVGIGGATERLAEHVSEIGNILRHKVRMTFKQAAA